MGDAFVRTSPPARRVVGKLDQHECNQIAGMVRNIMQAEELKRMNPEVPPFVPPVPDALS